MMLTAHKPWPKILALLFTLLALALMRLLWAESHWLFFIAVIVSPCSCIYWSLTYGSIHDRSFVPLDVGIGCGLGFLYMPDAIDWLMRWLAGALHPAQVCLYGCGC